MQSTFESASTAKAGDIVEAHVRITPVDNWEQTLYETERGDTDVFYVGPQTPECLNRAFGLVEVLSMFIVYCPADLILEGRGWRNYSAPG